MKYIKMIRRGDVIIVVVLMIASFLPLGVFSYRQATADEATIQAVVKVDGEIVKVFDLVDDGETEIFHYHDDHGHENTIVRNGASVEMIEANCGDQVCVRMNAIDAVGETILCLPHRLLVEVTSDEPVDQPEDSLDVLSDSRHVTGRES